MLRSRRRELRGGPPYTFNVLQWWYDSHMHLFSTNDLESTFDSALCKLTSQRASKSKLKRLPSALCDPMIAPSLADIDTLNSLWCIYIASVMSGAQSDAQLQARYDSYSSCSYFNSYFYDISCVKRRMMPCYYMATFSNEKWMSRSLIDLFHND